MKIAVGSDERTHLTDVVIEEIQKRGHDLLLFGPLADRVVPYLGALVGGTIPGRGANSPGYLYGGQVGVRFPVAQGFSIDVGIQYMRLEIDFKGHSDLSEQWLFTTGVRF